MVLTEEITAKRLNDWSKRLAEEHATPLMLIGIGHDHTSGQIALCIPEGIDMEILRTHLEFVLHNLSQR